MEEFRGLVDDFNEKTISSLYRVISCARDPIPDRFSTEENEGEKFQRKEEFLAITRNIVMWSPIYAALLTKRLKSDAFSSYHSDVSFIRPEICLL